MAFGKDQDPVACGKKSQFQRGHKMIEGAGRPTGKGVRKLLQELAPPEKLKELWEYFLFGKQGTKIVTIPKEIRFDAFKLALYYLHGRPPREPLDPDDRPNQSGMSFDTDAMPSRDERIN